MHRAWILFVLAVALTTSAVASADNAREAEAANAEGKTLYANSKQVAAESAKLALYKAALEKFRLAYKLDPKPKYLFNIAQAARFQDDCPIALGAYQRVAEMNGETEVEPDEKMKEIVRERIAELSPKCVPTNEFAAAAASPISSDAALAPTRPEKPEEKDDQSERPTTRWPTKRKAYLGISVGALGVSLGLLGYAVYQNRQIDSILADFQPAFDQDPYPVTSDDACDSPDITPGPKAVCDRGKSASRRGNISAVAAAGFGITSLVFGYLVYRGRPDPNGVVLGDGPGEVGASLLTRF